MVIELSLKWVKLHISFIQKCNQIHGKRKRYAIVKHTPENIYKKLCVHYLFYLSYLTHPSKQHQRDRKHREVGPTIKVESRSKRSVSGWIRWQSEEKVFHKSRTVETEIISLVELNAKGGSLTTLSYRWWNLGQQTLAEMLVAEADLSL